MKKLHNPTTEYCYCKECEKLCKLKKMVGLEPEYMKEIKRLNKKIQGK
jgi:predicted transglutaminase-like cysteine proteinase